MNTKNKPEDVLLKLRADNLVKSAEVVALKAETAELNKTIRNQSDEILYLRKQVDKLIDVVVHSCKQSSLQPNYGSTGTPFNPNKYEITCSILEEFLNEG